MNHHWELTEVSLFRTLDKEIPSFNLRSILSFCLNFELVIYCCEFNSGFSFQDFRTLHGPEHWRDPYLLQSYANHRYRQEGKPK